MTGASCLLQALHVRSSFQFPRHTFQPTLGRSASSLSSIHRGLRRSEGARPQGSRPKHGGSIDFPSGWPSAKTDGSLSFKIRMGKKNIAEEQKTRAPSRAQRFYKDNDGHGRGSMVRDMKMGRLRSDLEKLTDALGKTRSALESSTQRGNLQSSNQQNSEDKFAAAFSDIHDPRAARRDSRQQAVRPNKARRDGHSSNEEGSQKETDMNTPFQNKPNPPFKWRKPNTIRGDEETGRHRRKVLEGAFDEDGIGYGRTRNRDASVTGPISVPHTTAASQFLYGQAVVEAALRAGRRKFYKLYVYGGENRRKSQDDGMMISLARKAGVQVQIVEEKDQRLMEKMSAGRPHNGYILEASPLPQIPVKGLGPTTLQDGHMGYNIEALPQPAEDVAINGTDTFIRYYSYNGRKPLVLLIDGVQDPGNLGGILRTAQFMGVDAVVIPDRASAGLAPVALKSSAGAAETIRLFSTPNAENFISWSKQEGWKIYASVTRSNKQSHMTTDELEATESPLKQDPIILVVGSEGEGVSKRVRSWADVELSIPMYAIAKDVDSLNVSVATGLLLSAIVKQRTGPAKLERSDDRLF